MRSASTLRAFCTAFAFSLLLVGCGGGMSADTPVKLKQCDNTVPAGTATDDPSCGDVLVEVTDADGDFLAYEVDVVSLTLTRADGTQIELLPSTTRVDFAQLVQVSDLFTAARVPEGVYTSATLTLDYFGSHLVVERGGQPVDAVVVDPVASPICITTPCPTTQIAMLHVQLPSAHPLVVMPGTPAMLALDFDLAASNTVDLAAATPTIAVHPVITATLDRNLDDRDHRVRGPLLGPGPLNWTYLIGVRPAFVADGNFGRLVVHTTETTSFEIDGVTSTGAVGYTALISLPAGTATVALGHYDTTLRAYVATSVYAGSSVPGGTLDGALGAVRARSGDTLTLSGGTLVRATGEAGFAPDITVTLDASTQVRIAGREAPGTLAAISVGSRIEVLGAATVADDGKVSVVASLVRVVPSLITGTVVSLGGGTLVLDLQSLDARPVAAFDFAGTGVDAAHDADPQAYEVALGALIDATPAAGLHAGSPVAIAGFVADFGAAPADFAPLSVADYSSARAEIAVGWGATGTVAPFSLLATDALEIDLANPALGELHHLIRGPVATDLAALPATPAIVPGPATATALVGYAVHRSGTVILCATFGEFVATVQAALDAHAPLHEFFAHGVYDAAQNRFAAQQMLAVFD